MRPVFGVGTSHASSTRTSWKENAVSTDPFDVELEDAALLAEVELTADLIAAANQSDGHLAPEEIDRLLGLV
jgi:hypothetical protein